MSLSALLFYLWDRSGLTKWHPGFTGKRNWFIVRKRLLEVAGLTYVGRWALSERLFIPEVFKPESAAKIGAGHKALWHSALSDPPDHCLSLLIAEIKDITLSDGNGARVHLRQIPGRAFNLGSAHAEDALRNKPDAPRTVLMATTMASASGPRITELSLMPVTLQWLPISH